MGRRKAFEPDGRDEATLRAQLAEQQREMQHLRNRLRAVRDCTEHRCFLCLACLSAVHDE